MSMRSRMLWGLAAAGLTGCAAAPAMYTTYDVEYAPKRVPAVDYFGPGEVPTVYVQAHGGQTVSLEIVDLRDGQTVAYWTQYIPKGKDWFFPFSRLPKGSYEVTLKSESEKELRRWRFAVER